MALAESIEYDKIEVVGLYKAVQVRKATVIKKDGTEMARSYERYVLQAELQEVVTKHNQAQEVINQCKTRFTEIQAILKDRQED